MQQQFYEVHTNCISDLIVLRRRKTFKCTFLTINDKSLIFKIEASTNRFLFCFEVLVYGGHYGICINFKKSIHDKLFARFKNPSIVGFFLNTSL